MGVSSEPARGRVGGLVPLRKRKSDDIAWITKQLSRDCHTIATHAVYWVALGPWGPVRWRSQHAWQNAELG